MALGDSSASKTFQPDETEKPQQQTEEPSQLRRSKRRNRHPPDRLNLMSTHQGQTIAGCTLHSVAQDVLSKIHQNHGGEQFTKAKGHDVAEWLYQKVLEEELENWKGHYEVCKIANIPPGSNLVGSRVVYRVKPTDEGTFKFKARLVVHGNEGKEKDNIRKDSATACLTPIRLILSTAVRCQL